MKHSYFLPVLTILLLAKFAPDTARAGWELVLDDVSSPTSAAANTRPVTKPTSPQRAVVQSECQHIVQPGETLSGIARTRLGEAFRWRELATRNNLPDDGRVGHGTLLDLPCQDKATNTEYRDINTQEETRDYATAVREARAMNEKQVPQPIEVSEVANLPANVGESALSVAELPKPPPAETVYTDHTAEAEAVPAVPKESELPEVPEQADHKPESDQEKVDSDQIPVWLARGGSLLDEVIADWTLEAGYRLIIKDRWSWKLDYDYQYSGELKEAITDLMSGYAHSLPTPIVTFYNNDVVVLSVR